LSAVRAADLAARPEGEKERRREKESETGGEERRFRAGRHEIGSLIKGAEEESTASIGSIRDCIFIVITIAHQECISYSFYLFSPPHSHPPPSPPPSPPPPPPRLSHPARSSRPAIDLPARWIFFKCRFLRHLAKLEPRTGPRVHVGLVQFMHKDEVSSREVERSTSARRWTHRRVRHLSFSLSFPSPLPLLLCSTEFGIRNSAKYAIRKRLCMKLGFFHARSFS